MLAIGVHFRVPGPAAAGTPCEDLLSLGVRVRHPTIVDVFNFHERSLSASFTEFSTNDKDASKARCSLLGAISSRGLQQCLKISHSLLACDPSCH